MKVLKKGKESVYIGQCKRCESIIQALNSELTITCNSCPSVFYYIRKGICPECKEEIYFVLINSATGRKILKQVNNLANKKEEDYWLSYFDS